MGVGVEAVGGLVAPVAGEEGTSAVLRHMGAVNFTSNSLPAFKGYNCSTTQLHLPPDDNHVNVCCE